MMSNGLSIYNGTAGQAPVGSWIRSYLDHPSLWLIICRVPGAVKLRHAATGRETEIPFQQRVWLEQY